MAIIADVLPPAESDSRLRRLAASAAYLDARREPEHGVI